MENSIFIGGMPDNDMLALDDALSHLKACAEVSAKPTSVKGYQMGL